MNWDIVLQAVGIFIGAVVSLYQIQKLRPAPRSKLKSDLEILQLIDTSDENYAIIKAHVDNTVRQIYSDEAAKRSLKIDWGLVIFFSLLALGFIFWTLNLIQTEQQGWAILTGAVVLVALFGLTGSFGSDEQSVETNDKSEAGLSVDND